MAKRLQLRRGTTAEHSTFTGAVGEVTVDTDKDTIVVHDGATDGGIPMARADKLSGFKNHIINGGFDVWQRGTSFDGDHDGFSADRWILAADDDDHDFTLSKDIKGAKCEIGSTLSENFLLKQPMENLNRFVNKTMTLSVTIEAEVDTVIELGSVSQQTDSNYSYDSSQSGIFTVLAGSTQRLSKTIDIPDLFPSDAKDPVNSFCQFYVNILTESSVGVSYIRDVQLEEGSVATPFEQRPYGLELSLCQRYYLQDYVTIIAAIDYELYCFPSTMRTQPTVELPVDWTVENDASTNWHRLKRNTGGYGGTVKIDAELSYVY